jgi:ATP-dependent RNA circularization protein (DNA/RNA ligase family)
VGYDVSSNPRYLGPAPGFEAPEGPLGDSDDEIEDRVRVAREVQEVFRKRGWKHIRATLENLVEDAARSILDGRVETMEQVNEKRALIKAYQTLIDFPESAAMETDYWNSLLSK